MPNLEPLPRPHTQTGSSLPRAPSLQEPGLGSSAQQRTRDWASDTSWKTPAQGLVSTEGGQEQTTSAT